MEVGKKRKGIMGMEQGLTLVELMITLALMVIAAGIAIPFFQRYALNANLKAAARDIQSDIHQLKARAVAENIMYRISFDVTNNRYTLEQGTDTGTPYTALQTKPLTGVAADIRLTSTTFAGSTVVFQKRGTVSAGTVNLTNSRGSTAAVTATISGRAYVQFTLQ